MATNAAAALLKAALPKAPVASTSNHPNDSQTLSRSQGGQGIRGRAAGRGGRGGRSRAGEVRDEDVGMSDGDDAGGKRRGRQGARHSPMGDRPLMRIDGKPYNPNARGGARNAPSIIRDGGQRAQSTPARTNGSTGASAASSSTSIETIRLFLTSRYNAQDKLLNMENMASDTILNSAGVLAPGQVGAARDISPVIWKLASQMFPDAISLSLANNNLTSILPLSPYLLTTALPNLENVSLAANLLAQLRDLDPLSPAVGRSRADKKPKGWKNLKELVLTGNPLVQGGQQEDFYRREIARRFPSLRQLDQQPLDPSIAFVSSKSTEAILTPGLSPAAKRDLSKGKREPIAFPVSVTGGFFESEGTRDFVAGFLMKFFAAFDTDRPSLLSAYAPVCSFSFYTDTSYPLRSRAKRIGSHGDKKFPNQHKLDWKSYLTSDGSRNLARVKYPAKRIVTLKLTPSNIVSSIVTLPKTTHPLDQSEKFVFDTWTMPGLFAPAAPGVEGETVIYAVVHGEYIEHPTMGVRSFDRTFILAPAAPGSPAQVAGWPCMILSDVWCIRGYSDPAVWTPKSPPGTAPVASTSAPAALPIQERAEGITDQQQAIVLELAALTHLTYTFSHLCLVQNNWDPIAALSNFQALHATGAIPPEAFAP